MSDTNEPRELDRDQQDSWDAFKDSAVDVAAAVKADDGEDLQAAFAALKQVSQRLDSQAFLNALHVPKNAGEHEAGLRRILARIPDGWGRWISCGPGWFPLIVETDEALAAIDPDYEVHQVKEKYGCYDEETDVLTSEGWKRFADITMEDECATITPEGALEYQRPTTLTAEPYEGEMYRLRTRGVDLLVTPNHRLYVAKGTSWNGRYKPPKRMERTMEFVTPDVYFRQDKRFLKGARWEGADVAQFEMPELVYSHHVTPRPGVGKRPYSRTYRRAARTFEMDAWLHFLGWYVAEGCTSKSRADISISFDNTDGGTEREEVRKAIEGIGVEPHLECQDRSAGSFRIYDTHLARWLREHCGAGALEKKAPRFVGTLSERQIRIFLGSLYEGDGHQAPTAHSLTTASRHLADDVQELILKAGGASRLQDYCGEPFERKMSDGRIIRSSGNRFEVNWMKLAFHNTANKGLAPSSIEEWVPYQGMVYCATVPNETLFVRRNGIPVWCGNSLRYYFGASAGASQADSERLDKLASAAEGRSAKTCETCGAPGELKMTRARGPWYKTVCAEHSADGPYINKEEWDAFCAWWEENERPKLEAKQRQSFIDQRAGKRVLIAARDFTLPVSSTTAATPAGIAKLVKEMAPDGWHEIWVGKDELGDAALEAIKEIYADHAHEQATKEPDGAFGSRIIKHPEGSPTIVTVEHRDTLDVLKTGVRVMSYPKSYYTSE